MYMMQTTQYNAIQCTITMQTRQENTNTTQYITHLEGKKHTSQESKTYVKKQTSIQWVIIPFPKKKTKLEGPISRFRIATITVHYSMFCVCIHVDIIFSFV